MIKLLTTNYINIERKAVAEVPTKEATLTFPTFNISVPISNFQTCIKYYFYKLRNIL